MRQIEYFIQGVSLDRLEALQILHDSVLQEDHFKNYFDPDDFEESSMREFIQEMAYSPALERLVVSLGTRNQTDTIESVKQELSNEYELEE